MEFLLGHLYLTRHYDSADRSSQALVITSPAAAGTGTGADDSTHPPAATQPPTAADPLAPLPPSPSSTQSHGGPGAPPASAKTAAAVAAGASVRSSLGSLHFPPGLNSSVPPTPPHTLQRSTGPPIPVPAGGESTNSNPNPNSGPPPPNGAPSSFTGGATANSNATPLSLPGPCFSPSSPTLGPQLPTLPQQQGNSGSLASSVGLGAGTTAPGATQAITPTPTAAAGAGAVPGTGGASSQSQSLLAGGAPSPPVAHHSYSVPTTELNGKYVLLFIPPPRDLLPSNAKAPTSSPSSGAELESGAAHTTAGATINGSAATTTAAGAGRTTPVSTTGETFGIRTTPPPQRAGSTPIQPPPPPQTENSSTPVVVVAAGAGEEPLPPLPPMSGCSSRQQSPARVSRLDSGAVAPPPASGFGSPVTPAPRLSDAGALQVLPSGPGSPSPSRRSQTVLTPQPAVPGTTPTAAEITAATALYYHHRTSTTAAVRARQKLLVFYNLLLQQLRGEYETALEAEEAQLLNGGGCGEEHDSAGDAEEDEGGRFGEWNVPTFKATVAPTPGCSGVHLARPPSTGPPATAAGQLLRHSSSCGPPPPTALPPSTPLQDAGAGPTNNSLQMEEGGYLQTEGTTTSGSGMGDSQRYYPPGVPGTDSFGPFSGMGVAHPTAAQQQHHHRFSTAGLPTVAVSPCSVGTVQGGGSRAGGTAPSGLGGAAGSRPHPSFLSSSLHGVLAGPAGGGYGDAAAGAGLLAGAGMGAWGEIHRIAVLELHYSSTTLPPSVTPVIRTGCSRFGAASELFDAADPTASAVAGAAVEASVAGTPAVGPWMQKSPLVNAVAFLHTLCTNPAPATTIVTTTTTTTTTTTAAAAPTGGAGATNAGGSATVPLPVGSSASPVGAASPSYAASLNPSAAASLRSSFALSVPNSRRSTVGGSAVISTLPSTTTTKAGTLVIPAGGCFCGRGHMMDPPLPPSLLLYTDGQPQAGTLHLRGLAPVRATPLPDYPPFTAPGGSSSAAVKPHSRAATSTHHRHSHHRTSHHRHHVSAHGTSAVPTPNPAPQLPISPSPAPVVAAPPPSSTTPSGAVTSNRSTPLPEGSNINAATGSMPRLASTSSLGKASPPPPQTPQTLGVSNADLGPPMTSTNAGAVKNPLLDGLPPLPYAAGLDSSIVEGNPFYGGWYSVRSPEAYRRVLATCDIHTWPAVVLLDPKGEVVTVHGLDTLEEDLRQAVIFAKHSGGGGNHRSRSLGGTSNSATGVVDALAGAAEAAHPQRAPGSTSSKALQGPLGVDRLSTGSPTTGAAEEDTVNVGGAMPGHTASHMQIPHPLRTRLQWAPHGGLLQHIQQQQIAHDGDWLDVATYVHTQFHQDRTSSSSPAAPAAAGTGGAAGASDGSAAAPGPSTLWYRGGSGTITAGPPPLLLLQSSSGATTPRNTRGEPTAGGGAGSGGALPPHSAATGSLEKTDELPGLLLPPSRASTISTLSRPTVNTMPHLPTAGADGAIDEDDAPPPRSPVISTASNTADVARRATAGTASGSAMEARGTDQPPPRSTTGAVPASAPTAHHSTSILEAATSSLSPPAPLSGSEPDTAAAAVLSLHAIQPGVAVGDLVAPALGPPAPPAAGAAPTAVPLGSQSSGTYSHRGGAALTTTTTTTITTELDTDGEEPMPPLGEAHGDAVHRIGNESQPAYPAHTDTRRGSATSVAGTAEPTPNVNCDPLHRQPLLSATMAPPSAYTTTTTTTTTATATSGTFFIQQEDRSFSPCLLSPLRSQPPGPLGRPAPHAGAATATEDGTRNERDQERPTAPAGDAEKANEALQLPHIPLSPRPSGAPAPALLPRVASSSVPTSTPQQQQPPPPIAVPGLSLNNSTTATSAGGAGRPYTPATASAASPYNTPRATTGGGGAGTGATGPQLWIGLRSAFPWYPSRMHNMVRQRSVACGAAAPMRHLLPCSSTHPSYDGPSQESRRPPPLLRAEEEEALQWMECGVDTPLLLLLGEAAGREGAEGPNAAAHTTAAPYAGSNRQQPPISAPQGAPRSSTALASSAQQQQQGQGQGGFGLPPLAGSGDATPALMGDEGVLPPANGGAPRSKAGSTRSGTATGMNPRPLMAPTTTATGGGRNRVVSTGTGAGAATAAASAGLGDRGTSCSSPLQDSLLTDSVQDDRQASGEISLGSLENVVNAAGDAAFSPYSSGQPQTVPSGDPLLPFMGPAHRHQSTSIFNNYLNEFPAGTAGPMTRQQHQHGLSSVGASLTCGWHGLSSTSVPPALRAGAAAPGSYPLAFPCAGAAMPLAQLMDLSVQVRAVVSDTERYLAPGELLEEEEEEEEGMMIGMPAGEASSTAGAALSNTSSMSAKGEQPLEEWFASPVSGAPHTGAAAEEEDERTAEKHHPPAADRASYSMDHLGSPEMDEQTAPPPPARAALHPPALPHSANTAWSSASSEGAGPSTPTRHRRRAPHHAHGESLATTDHGTNDRTEAPEDEDGAGARRSSSSTKSASRGVAGVELPAATGTGTLSSAGPALGPHRTPSVSSTAASTSFAISSLGSLPGEEGRTGAPERTGLTPQAAAPGQGPAVPPAPLAGQRRAAGNGASGGGAAPWSTAGAVPMGASAATSWQLCPFASSGVAMPPPTHLLLFFGAGWHPGMAEAVERVRRLTESLLRRSGIRTAAAAAPSSERRNKRRKQTKKERKASSPEEAPGAGLLRLGLDKAHLFRDALKGFVGMPFGHGSRSNSESEGSTNEETGSGFSHTLSSSCHHSSTFGSSTFSSTSCSTDVSSQGGGSSSRASAPASASASSASDHASPRSPSAELPFPKLLGGSSLGAFRCGTELPFSLDGRTGVKKANEKDESQQGKPPPLLAAAAAAAAAASGWNLGGLRADEPLQDDTGSNGSGGEKAEDHRVVASASSGAHSHAEATPGREMLEVEPDGGVLLTATLDEAAAAAALLNDSLFKSFGEDNFLNMEEGEEEEDKDEDGGSADGRGASNPRRDIQRALRAVGKKMKARVQRHLGEVDEEEEVGNVSVRSGNSSRPDHQHSDDDAEAEDGLFDGDSRGSGILRGGLRQPDALHLQAERYRSSTNADESDADPKNSRDQHLGPPERPSQGGGGKPKDEKKREEKPQRRHLIDGVMDGGAAVVPETEEEKEERRWARAAVRVQVVYVSLDDTREELLETVQQMPGSWRCVSKFLSSPRSRRCGCGAAFHPAGGFGNLSPTRSHTVAGRPTAGGAPSSFHGQWTHYHIPALPGLEAVVSSQRLSADQQAVFSTSSWEGESCTSDGPAPHTAVRLSTDQPATATATAVLGPNERTSQTNTVAPGLPSASSAAPPPPPVLPNAEGAGAGAGVEGREMKVEQPEACEGPLHTKRFASQEEERPGTATSSPEGSPHLNAGPSDPPEFGTLFSRSVAPTGFSTKTNTASGEVDLPPTRGGSHLNRPTAHAASGSPVPPTSRSTAAATAAEALWVKAAAAHVMKGDAGVAVAASSPAPTANNTTTTPGFAPQGAAAMDADDHSGTTPSPLPTAKPNPSATEEGAAGGETTDATPPSVGRRCDALGVSGDPPRTAKPSPAPRMSAALDNTLRSRSGGGGACWQAAAMATVPGGAGIGCSPLGGGNSSSGAFAGGTLGSYASLSGGNNTQQHAQALHLPYPTALRSEDVTDEAIRYFQARFNVQTLPRLVVLAQIQEEADPGAAAAAAAAGPPSTSMPPPPLHGRRDTQKPTIIGTTDLSSAGLHSPASSSSPLNPPLPRHTIAGGEGEYHVPQSVVSNESIFASNSLGVPGGGGRPAFLFPPLPMPTAGAGAGDVPLAECSTPGRQPPHSRRPPPTAAGGGRGVHPHAASSAGAAVSDAAHAPRGLWRVVQRHAERELPADPKGKQFPWGVPLAPSSLDGLGLDPSLMPPPPTLPPGPAAGPTGAATDGRLENDTDAAGAEAALMGSRPRGLERGEGTHCSGDYSEGGRGCPSVLLESNDTKEDEERMEGEGNMEVAVGRIDPARRYSSSHSHTSQMKATRCSTEVGKPQRSMEKGQREAEEPRGRKYRAAPVLLRPDRVNLFSSAMPGTASLWWMLEQHNPTPPAEAAVDHPRPRHKNKKKGGKRTSGGESVMGSLASRAHWVQYLSRYGAAVEPLRPFSMADPTPGMLSTAAAAEAQRSRAMLPFQDGSVCIVLCAFGEIEREVHVASIRVLHAAEQQLRQALEHRRSRALLVAAQRRRDRSSSPGGGGGIGVGIGMGGGGLLPGGRGSGGGGGRLPHRRAPRHGMSVPQPQCLRDSLSFLQVQQHQLLEPVPGLTPRGSGNATSGTSLGLGAPAGGEGPVGSAPTAASASTTSAAPGFSTVSPLAASHTPPPFPTGAGGGTLPAPAVAAALREASEADDGALLTAESMDGAARHPPLYDDAPPWHERERLYPHVVLLDTVWAEDAAALYRTTLQGATSSEPASEHRKALGGSAAPPPCDVPPARSSTGSKKLLGGGGAGRYSAPSSALSTPRSDPAPVADAARPPIQAPHPKGSRSRSHSRNSSHRSKAHNSDRGGAAAAAPKRMDNTVDLLRRHRREMEALQDCVMGPLLRQPDMTLMPVREGEVFVVVMKGPPHKRHVAVWRHGLEKANPNPPPTPMENSATNSNSNSTTNHPTTAATGVSSASSAGGGAGAGAGPSSGPPTPSHSIPPSPPLGASPAVFRTPPSTAGTLSSNKDHSLALSQPQASPPGGSPPSAAAAPPVSLLPPNPSAAPAAAPSTAHRRVRSPTLTPGPAGSMLQRRRGPVTAAALTHAVHSLGSTVLHRDPTTMPGPGGLSPVLDGAATPTNNNGSAFAANDAGSTAGGTGGAGGDAASKPKVPPLAPPVDPRAPLPLEPVIRFLRCHVLDES